MNRVVHFEIHAQDLDQMQSFYQHVFGWDVKDLGAPMGGYRLLTTGPQGAAVNGGMLPRRGPGPVEGAPVNAFVCTIGVDDLTATLDKVTTSGGSMALDRMEVPGVGQLAYCKDPEGNIFGLLQPVS